MAGNATLTDQAALAADATFQSRVQQAIVAAAIAISNEATNAGFHKDRATLAKAVMNSPQTYAVLFAKAVAQDATIMAQAGTPFTNQQLVLDAAIANAVSGVWNSFFSIFG